MEEAEDDPLIFHIKFHLDSISIQISESVFYFSKKKKKNIKKISISYFCKRKKK